MHAGKKFTIRQVLFWTRREILVFVLIASVPTVLYQIFGFHWLVIPWLPVALIGTAVAFLIGFKNNASYGRLWEARKIWGAIVNASRTWAMMVKDFVNSDFADRPVDDGELKASHKRLVHRHIAWLTALRFQLRQPKPWESMDKRHAKEYRNFYSIPELETKLEDEMRPYLSKDDLAHVLGKTNRATQLLGLQSSDIRELRKKKLIDAFPYLELENLLEEFFTHQGKAERIKSFPYPRQFATFNVYFVWIFIALVPLGMMQEIQAKLGEPFVWLTIPLTVLVVWVFHTMEKIGEATENPFEGGANDIPMANMSRTIEIDMREMLNELEIPEPTTAVNDILM